MLIAAISLTAFLGTLFLLTRFIWIYTGSSTIIPHTQIHSADEQEPLLGGGRLAHYKNHVKLTRTSLFLGIYLLGSSMFLLAMDNGLIAVEPSKKSNPNHLAVQDISLLFTALLLFSVCLFALVEFRAIAKALIIEHNRQDRLLSSLPFLTKYLSWIWIISLIATSASFIDDMYSFAVGTMPTSVEYDFWHFVVVSSQFSLLVIVLAALQFKSLLFPTLEDYNSQLSVNGGFWLDRRRLKQLAPFLWPDSLYLQFLVVVCFVLLVMGRVVNVLVPIQYKIVVDALTDGPDKGSGDKRPYYAWMAILMFVSLRFLQGGVGLVSTLQSLLWIPVGQYNTREVSVKMFAHLHSLSLQFHLNRKTGEVLRVMDRGTSSVGSLLSYILFNIFPVFVDIAVAVVYFVFLFDWLFGLLVFMTMAVYIAFTIWITEWRTAFRRDMIELDNASRARAVDSLLNFETVKYYNNEDFEISKFHDAIVKYQEADWKASASLNVLNTAQNATITIGLLIGSLISAQRVVDGAMTVGEFVLFMTYIVQLYQPLNWFGTYYRVIQQNFIDMEKMFELFDQEQTIKDKDDAREFVSHGGRIVFENVSFAYDSRAAAIHDISFTAEPGQTVALVGPSGGGKSTIFRLLFRFYEAQQGKITIDGQNIADVTQKSLRKHIGVVPQDTVLFNDTIMYNIRYGNPEASDAKVEAATKAARIHDTIMAFPDGYQTKVGERGLRLSGGEKQRVAIARTILKDPTIILLDEATSALDNTTEKQIQNTLETLYSGEMKRRTKLVIAHRLSTIMKADLILVIQNGRIVERGTHSELLSKGREQNGVYYSMWTSQEEKQVNGS